MSWEIQSFPCQLFRHSTDAKDKESFIKNLIDWKKKVALSEIGRTKITALSTDSFVDKASLILVPLMASAGITIPIFSGYHLIDNKKVLEQLESIPGFKALRDPEDIKTQLLRIGAAILSVPKPFNSFLKKIYHAEDDFISKDKKEITYVIGAAALMSDAKGIVFDIKVGNSAFIKNVKEARIVALSLKNICHQMNIQPSYIISNMNPPLGQAIGSSLELFEAIEILKGKGPLDILKIVLELGTEMLLLADKAPNRMEAKKYLKGKILKGEALKKLKEIILAQRGDVRFIDDYSILPRAKKKINVFSEKKGFIQNINLDRIRLLGIELGILRKKEDHPIDHGAGFLIYKKIGDRVEKNEALGALQFNTIKDRSFTKKEFREAFIISPDPPDFCPFIIERSSAIVEL